jgi:hypothetical protein
MILVHRLAVVVLNPSMFNTYEPYMAQSKIPSLRLVVSITSQASKTRLRSRTPKQADNLPLHNLGLLSPR